MWMTAMVQGWVLQSEQNNRRKLSGSLLVSAVCSHTWLQIAWGWSSRIACNILQVERNVFDLKSPFLISCTHTLQDHLCYCDLISPQSPRVTSSAPRCQDADAFHSDFRSLIEQLFLRSHAASCVCVANFFPKKILKLKVHPEPFTFIIICMHI